MQRWILLSRIRNSYRVVQLKQFISKHFLRTSFFEKSLGTVNFDIKGVSFDLQFIKVHFPERSGNPFKYIKLHDGSKGTSF